MYTLNEIKSFSDVNNGAISKEVGEGIINTFNGALRSVLSTSAKKYYPEICLEVAIRNYRVGGITSDQTVEHVVIEYLYKKLNEGNRRGILKLPLLPCSKELVKTWIFNDIKENNPTDYEWNIEIN